MWRPIKDLFESEQRFLLTTHINPDGDGVGSAIAMAELLFFLGKEVALVCDSPMPSNLTFLDVRKIYHTYEQWQGDHDILIILDTHSPERLGRVATLIDQKSVIIDHHRAKKGVKNAIIDEEACSVGAMIYTLCKECGYALSPAAAAGIYVSVISDTGRFSYSSTSRKAHKLADECIGLGVDPAQMHRRLYQQMPIEQLQVLARALPRMEVDGGIVVQTVLQEDLHGVDPGDLDWIHELNKSVRDLDCALLLRELSDGSVRASLRTGPRIDANKVATHFGGGGHTRAAGATLDGPIDQAKMRLVKILKSAIIE